ncbi:MAG: YqaJ viral recombinase family protein [Bacteroidaceae bacterium]|nr:YqaJ viral recombinase family protein [Bacteroidaceae bacterium]
MPEKEIIVATQFIEYKDRESWLAGRKNSIGASEVAAAIGISPFMTPNELWEIKTGRREPKDLSTSSRVIFGQQAEGLVRDLYMLEHTEYTLEYHPYRVYYQEETPFLTATLDGELTRMDGVKGIYEGKTAECTKKAQWEKWNGKVPDNYYTQLCHQLWCAGEEFKFSILNAKIKGLNGDSSLRSYEFEREAMEADIEWIIKEATEFWRLVQEDKRPPLVF